MSRSEDEAKLRDEQAAIYDSWYLERGKWNVKIEDLAVKHALKLERTDVFMDMGCGTGRLTEKLATKCKSTYGYDISPASIEIMKNKGLHGCAMGGVLDITVNNIPLSLKVDKILSVQMIQHIEKKYHAPVIKKLYDALKEKGILVIELYNFAGYFRKKEMKAGGGIKKEIQVDNFYEYRFSPSEMIALFSAAGFKNIKCYGVSNISRGVVNRLRFLALPLEWILEKFSISKRIGYYFIIKGEK